MSEEKKPVVEIWLDGHVIGRGYGAKMLFPKITPSPSDGGWAERLWLGASPCHAYLGPTLEDWIGYGPEHTRAMAEALPPIRPPATGWPHGMNGRGSFGGNCDCRECLADDEAELAKAGTCPRCGGLIKIRNPTGWCDHLQWPENIAINRPSPIRVGEDDPEGPWVITLPADWETYPPRKRAPADWTSKARFLTTAQALEIMGLAKPPDPRLTGNELLARLAAMVEEGSTPHFAILSLELNERFGHKIITPEEADALHRSITDAIREAGLDPAEVAAWPSTTAPELGPIPSPGYSQPIEGSAPDPAEGTPEERKQPGEPPGDAG